MKLYEKPMAELIDFQPMEQVMLGGEEGSQIEDWDLEEEEW